MVLNAIYYLYLDYFPKEFEDIYNNKNIYKTAEIKIRLLFSLPSN